MEQVLRKIGKWEFRNSGLWHSGDVGVGFFQDINIPNQYIVKVSAQNKDYTFYSYESPCQLGSFKDVEATSMLDALTNVEKRLPQVTS